MRKVRTPEMADPKFSSRSHTPLPSLPPKSQPSRTIPIQPRSLTAQTLHGARNRRAPETANYILAPISPKGVIGECVERAGGVGVRFPAGRRGSGAPLGLARTLLSCGAGRETSGRHHRTPGIWSGHRSSQPAGVESHRLPRAGTRLTRVGPSDGFAIVNYLT